ncbi:helix-turn-helix domain-containing protein [Candidatus Bathyarchaeota archaeon]|nr:helix-turn-helix domain-containing protein [Candidatus Bathyarchaeota archaeon]
MPYSEREKIAGADAVLKEAGFTVSDVCCSRPSCFDFAARKNSTVIFIKLQTDIGNLSPSDCRELRVISESVSATSLLIGKKTREKPLEDDTVYTRYDIVAITPRTFENVAIHKTEPLIQAGPGGYYVEVDGEALKQRRQELGLSIGEMAEMVGLSRRTLYGYERGMAKASVTAAYNLIATLGIPVAKSLNIFEKTRSQHKCFLTKARAMLTRNRLLQKAFRRLSRWNIVTVRRAPFDFVVSVPEEKMRIIGGIAGKNERELSKRISEILSISRVVQAHPVLITEGQKLSNNEISCIYGEELDRIRNPGDLIAGVR